MANSLYIRLKSGTDFIVEDFKYINYPNGSSGSLKITDFENFYLYNKLLTFVGGNDIISLSSCDIEYIRFKGNFNE